MARKLNWRWRACRFCLRQQTAKFQLICKPSLDTILGTQDIGLDWLDSVDHLLEKDEEGSRTAEYSGFEVDDLRRKIG